MTDVRETIIHVMLWGFVATGAQAAVLFGSQRFGAEHRLSADKFGVRCAGVRKPYKSVLAKSLGNCFPAGVALFHSQHQ